MTLLRDARREIRVEKSLVDGANRRSVWEHRLLYKETVTLATVGAIEGVVHRLSVILAQVNANDAFLHYRAAVMENHFRYEERQLRTVLDTLALDAEPRDVLGPL
ncbi:MAG: hypothetical protein ACRDQA_20410 [Nocardioidaceae bacterium]